MDTNRRRAFTGIERNVGHIQAFTPDRCLFSFYFLLHILSLLLLTTLASLPPGCILSYYLLLQYLLMSATASDC